MLYNRLPTIICNDQSIVIITLPNLPAYHGSPLPCILFLISSVHRTGVFLDNHTTSSPSPIRAKRCAYMQHLTSLPLVFPLLSIYPHLLDVRNSYSNYLKNKYYRIRYYLGEKKGMVLVLKMPLVCCVCYELMSFELGQS